MARPLNASRAASVVLRVVVMLGLAWFYYLGATEHARRQNMVKARADQSGYLYDAQVLYRNWHGLNDPPRLVDRNRMPLYGAYQAWLYDPRLSNDEFFEVAKRRNIVLSLVLLGALAIVVAWQLPPLSASNLTLIMAFGYFVFKAGYVQSELLFYFLFFCAFLCCWHLFLARRPAVAMVLAAFAGLFCALAHLSKAAVLPFAALVVAVLVLMAGWRLVVRRGSIRLAAWPAACAVVFAAVFLGVLWPYLSNSKRVFRQYFYNVNSTFYAWSDTWPEAYARTLPYGDHEHWPDVPKRDLPGPGRYWREHTAKQILIRLGGGFRDMGVRSYQTFWYLKFLVLYAAFGLLLAARFRSRIAAMIAAHRALAVFLALYAGVYLVAIAFYAPISDTGTTRFLLAHVAPFLFAMSVLFERFSSSPFHLFVSLTLAFDLAFVIWPRLMTTYGGF